MSNGSAIIQLIGLPATGKLTIARAMAGLAASRGHHLVVVDNHLTGNPILSVLDVDGRTAPPSEAWPLVYEIREIVTRAIGTLSPPSWSFVFTNVLTKNGDSDTRSVQRLADLAEQRGSRYVPVVLDCAVDELAHRVTGAGRSEQHKLTDPDIVREYAATRGLYRPDVPGRIDLDVTNLAAEDAAKRILDATLV